MFIELDLATLPPAMTLHEADDLTSFAVRARTAEHTFVALDQLGALVAEHAADPEWRERFEAMLAYAERQGWTRADGAVRAHIEWQE